MMLACRPVEWPTQGPLATADPTPIYPGSTVKPCQRCEQDVYLGPKGQEALDERPELPVLCFECSIIAAGPYGPEVRDLGNTYLP